jgi:hypothetical protein
MKKVFAIVISAILLLSMVPAVALATPEGLPDDADRLYKLNIIGVPKDKTADMKDNDGKRIFVKLDGKSAIYLQEALEEDGETPIPYTDPRAFAVLDANGTDADGALFQMPKPGLDPYVVGDKEGKDVGPTTQSLLGL